MSKSKSKKRSNKRSKKTEFIKLAKKYNINYKGLSRSKIANLLNNIRSEYLTNAEYNIIYPFINNKKSHRRSLKTIKKGKKTKRCKRVNNQSKKRGGTRDQHSYILNSEKIPLVPRYRGDVKYRKNNTYYYNNQFNGIIDCYINNICNIDSNESLEELLNGYLIQILNGRNISPGKSNYIIPYCSEYIRPEFKVTLTKKLDKVNYPSIGKDIINLLEGVFRIPIDFNTYGNSLIQEGNNQWNAPHMDVNLFYEYLKYNIIPSISSPGISNAMVIVTHSHFLKYFIRSIEDLQFRDTMSIIFDNLDILELIFTQPTKGNSASIYDVRIRRWKDNYNIDEPNEYDNKVHIFLMRHCLACHNIIPNDKSGLYTKFTKMASGRTSICIPNTIYELQSPLASIQNPIISKDSDCNSSIFNPREAINQSMDTITPPLYTLLKPWIISGNITYGSSIIYRSILTSILVQVILNNHHETLQEAPLG